METKRFEDLEFQQLERESRQDEEKESHTQQLLCEMADYQRGTVNRKASDLLVFSKIAFKKNKRTVTMSHFGTPYVEYVFKILPGATGHSKEADHPDYSAGSAGEGKLLKGEEQSRGNAAKGTMNILLLFQRKNASTNLPILFLIPSLRKKRNSLHWKENMLTSLAAGDPVCGR